MFKWEKNKFSQMGYLRQKGFRFAKAFILNNNRELVMEIVSKIGGWRHFKGLDLRNFWESTRNIWEILAIKGLYIGKKIFIFF